MRTAVDELKALLGENNDQPTPLLALKSLHAAFALCTEVITTDRLAYCERTDMVSLLAELLKAFHTGQALFSDTIPALLEQTVAGRRLQEAFQEYEGRLAHVTGKLEQVQEALKPLMQQEGMLRGQASEYAVLAQRHIELERLKCLADNLEPLQQQVQTLDAHLGQISNKVDCFEEEMAEKAERLVQLSATLLAQLKPEVQRAFVQADNAEKALCETITQLQTTRRRYQQMDTELQKRLEILRCYHDADRAVAQAFPAVQTVDNITIGQALDEIEHRLRQLDEVFQQAIQANTHTQRCEPRFFGEGDS